MAKRLGYLASVAIVLAAGCGGESDERSSPHPAARAESSAIGLTAVTSCAELEPIFRNAARASIDRKVDDLLEQVRRRAGLRTRPWCRSI